MRTVDLLITLRSRGAYGHMDDGLSGWMWLNAVVWLIVIVILAGLVVWLVMWLNRPAGSTGADIDSARRILAERFARGEIDADEYARRREMLG